MKFFLKILVGLFIAIPLFIAGFIFVLWAGWYDPSLRSVQNYAVLLEVEYQEKIYRQINVFSCRNREVINPNPEASTVPNFLHVEVGNGQYIVANVQGKCWSNDVEISLKELEQLDNTNWPKKSRQLKVRQQSFVNLSADPVYVDKYLRASKLKDGSLGVGLVTAKAIKVQAEPKKILGKFPKWKDKLGGRDPAYRSPFLLEVGYSMTIMDGLPSPPRVTSGENAGGGYVRIKDKDRRMAITTKGILPSNMRSFLLTKKETMELGPYIDPDLHRQALYFDDSKKWYFDSEAPKSVLRFYLGKEVTDDFNSITVDGAILDDRRHTLWSEKDQRQIYILKH